METAAEGCCACVQTERSLTELAQNGNANLELPLLPDAGLPGMIQTDGTIRH